MSKTSYIGVDCGFIFFDDTGIRWPGLISIEETENNYRLESIFIDGKPVGRRYYPGEYGATIKAYSNPFGEIGHIHRVFGISYRERYTIDNDVFYRLHMVHFVSTIQESYTTETINQTSTPSIFTWKLESHVDQLVSGYYGSHLILDSAYMDASVFADIESILYGHDDQNPRLPTVDEIITYLATMNLVIIDHGDGTWSATGNSEMIQMISNTEFSITAPTIQYVSEDETTYTIESWIRNDL